MLLDPRFRLLDDGVVVDLYQRFQVGERERIQIEASKKEVVPIHGGNLRMKNRAVPLVNGNTGRQQGPIEGIYSPRPVLTA